jgi:hypothetical protein
MGRRSRKRALADAGSAAGPAEAATTRADRDAARRSRASSGGAARRRPPRPGRPRIEDRPKAPWGSFPLSELIILVGIGLMTWGLLTWSSQGHLRFGAGLALASLGGLELSLREHLAGYRSHSSLLAGAAAVAVVSVLALGPGPHVIWALLAIAVAIFGGAFYGLRELFKRRSGGLGFR